MAAISQRKSGGLGGRGERECAIRVREEEWEGRGGFPEDSTQENINCPNRNNCFDLHHSF